jgi:Tfp pilus assembly protein PilV
MARRSHPGLTLLEVVLASVLLVAAAVPILNAATRAVTLAQEVEWRTRATFRAQAEMENVLGLAAQDFNRDFTKNSADLGDGYRVTVQQSLLTAIKKTILVKIGRDKNGNAILDDSEVLVTLGTVVANRGN